MKKQALSNRWVWYCDWDNGASHWEDSESCHAGSRKPTSKQAAQAALDKHQYSLHHMFGRFGRFGGLRQLRKYERYGK